MPPRRAQHHCVVVTCVAAPSGAQEGVAVYSSVKGALNAYTRVAASETGHDGITVNSLNLGVFITEMLQNEILEPLEKAQPGASEAFLKGFASNTALGRLGDPREVEGLVQLLASDAGSYITGASIEIDGGLAIMMKPN